MDSTFYPGQFREDYLSEDMFTSQPQDYSSTMACTGTNMGSMTSMDTMDFLGLSSLTSSPDIFPPAPALTPSNESDISAASDLTWYEPNIQQDASTFDMTPTIITQGPSFPMVAQFDSPVSMPSSCGEMFSQDWESQMPYLDMPQPAFDPSISGFGVAPPATLAGPNYMDQVYSIDQVTAMPLGSTDQMHRRMSSESSGPREARSDERYKRGPSADGRYHCPFDNCDHEPDKLKCNYDKHLDAHLRPYRCKKEACASVPFSSTACVLRHEREAHGMHGHGEKPFVCQFPDCERSQAKNGFPRKWNLGDHMKRVHNYDAAASEKSNGLSTPPDSPEIHAPGPMRTKRSQRTGSKATSKKATRSSVPQPQMEEQNTVLVQVPDMPQEFTTQYFQPQWDTAQMSNYGWTQ